MRVTTAGPRGEPPPRRHDHQRGPELQPQLNRGARRSLSRTHHPQRGREGPARPPARPVVVALFDRTGRLPPDPLRLRAIPLARHPARHHAGVSVDRGAGTAVAVRAPLAGRPHPRSGARRRLHGVVHRVARHRLRPRLRRDDGGRRQALGFDDAWTVAVAFVTSQVAVVMAAYGRLVRHVHVALRDGDRVGHCRRSVTAVCGALAALAAFEQTLISLVLLVAVTAVTPSRRSGTYSRHWSASSSAASPPSSCCATAAPPTTASPTSGRPARPWFVDQFLDVWPLLVLTAFGGAWALVICFVRVLDGRRTGDVDRGAGRRHRPVRVRRGPDPGLRPRHLAAAARDDPPRRAARGAATVARRHVARPRSRPGAPPDLPVDRTRPVRRPPPAAPRGFDPAPVPGVLP